MNVVRRKRKQFIILTILLIAIVWLLVFRVLDAGDYCRTLFGWNPRDPSLILTTGYCNCGECCGWTRTKDGVGEAVYNYGALKGKKKKVGFTATGTRAKHGTIAADPKVFKMGTRLIVPGYGVGTVEDVGGAIKGRHIDLWFPAHDDAKRWGRKWLKVEVEVVK